jgi:Kdo2-lipid IVA lauroyltransferase/acyltransferase
MTVHGGTMSTLYPNAGKRTRRLSLAAVLQAPLWLLYPVYVTFVLALRSLPESAALFLGNLFYARLACLARRRRLNNFESLLRPLGWADGALEKLECDYLAFQARFAVELARMSQFDSATWKRHVALTGEPELRSALAEDRGALIVGCHLANWVYISTALAVNGFSVSNVAARVPFPPLEHDLQRVRRRTGVQCTLLGEGGAQAAASAFARGGIFCTLIDLSLRPERSALVPFGATKLRVDLGPARLALHHDVPVFFAWCHASPDDQWFVTLQPLGRPSTLSPAEQTPEALTINWLRTLHDVVLKHPEQWWPWSFTALGK